MNKLIGLGMGVILLLLAVLSVPTMGAGAFQATPTSPAPTLVPPTPMPVQATPQAVVADVSSLASVQETRVLRVGTLYNAYPFAWLNEYGEVDGYEAEILRAIGIELEVEIEFVQVTRQNAIDMLHNGQVDILIGQQVLTRDRENTLDFSHPYFLNQERMVKRQDSPYADLSQMMDKPVAVEVGSRSERALRHWMAASGVQLDVRTYFSESLALDALSNGEVEGMVGPEDSLRRAGRQGMSFVDSPLLLEPYAIALRGWDVNMRNLLNRSLQRLKASGRLDEIYGNWFPGTTMDFDLLVPVYDTLYEDARKLDDFPTDIPMPNPSVVSRIADGLPIRVAGLVGEGEEAPAIQRIINALNKAMIEEMARRWGAKLEYIPNSYMNAVDLVANGQADLAVGASPRWDGADRAEYSVPYIRHGDRLLVPSNSKLTTGFADMLGTGWIIGYFADDAPDADHIKKMAEIFNVSRNISDPFQILQEDRAIYTMVGEQNIDAIYGDSLRLLALMRDYEEPDQVKLLDKWYGDVLPISFGMPRNDAEFRALVDFTLQDMAQDGTYQRFWADLFGLGDPLPMLYWAATSPDTP
ncbi:MAG TPA: transporter substrate-binding domain-containing protein [Aggregatilineaceae bacterium]|nr:transporter substrate-binding domain-containing protein [Aggregatilineaceae bacterium]